MSAFTDGHKVEGKESIINGKKYENPPAILGNKDKYEFLSWDCRTSEIVCMFDIRITAWHTQSIYAKR